MRRVVEQQRLGFVATVCADGTPNLSPKWTVAVWDDDTLIVADIRSPRIARNLVSNPAVEINAVAFFRTCGTSSPIRAVVLVAVQRALPHVSPAYDLGQTEEQVRARWRAHYQALDEQAAGEGATQSVDR